MHWDLFVMVVVVVVVLLGGGGYRERKIQGQDPLYWQSSTTQIFFFHCVE